MDKRLWVGVVSIFPEMFRAISDYGITSRAVKQGLLTLTCWNPRVYTEDRHQTVDDRPFGGGPGMVMKIKPLEGALADARQAAGGRKAKVIYLSQIPPRRTPSRMACSTARTTPDPRCMRTNVFLKCCSVATMNTSGVGVCSRPLGGPGNDAPIFWIAARFLEKSRSCWRNTSVSGTIVNVSMAGRLPVLGAQHDQQDHSADRS